MLHGVYPLALTPDREPTELRSLAGESALPHDNCSRHHPLSSLLGDTVPVIRDLTSIQNIA